ncbi:hypothetical protein, partial [Acidaminococcus intestini]|uniref:hypothetical protein n=1 Tax=Acidaminococcus intestini TaxID=187327 RepID=UPI002675F1C7
IFSSQGSFLAVILIGDSLFSLSLFEHLVNTFFVAPRSSFCEPHPFGRVLDYNSTDGAFRQNSYYPFYLE